MIYFIYLFLILVEFLTVDFLIPDEKIVIETYGPHHFIKHIKNGANVAVENELNMNTEFTCECLEMLGYKIIPLNFDFSSLNKKSLELYFFEKYEAIHKNNSLQSLKSND